MLSPTVLFANKKIEDVNDFLHQKGHQYRYYYTLATYPWFHTHLL